MLPWLRIYVCGVIMSLSGDKQSDNIDARLTLHRDIWMIF